MGITLIIALLVSGMTSSIVCLVMFDKLLTIQFHEFREEWTTDKMPTGFFWIPDKESSYTPGSMSRAACLLHWLMYGADWITGHTRARRLLAGMRIAFGITCMSSLMFLPSIAIIYLVT